MTWAMDLPPGVVDPIYLCEMALKFHMSIAELCHGRGTPMSAHELCVVWPAYWNYQRNVADREAAKAEDARVRV
jgi:hypothetical protein